MQKQQSGAAVEKHKLKAKWLNKPQVPNLMERTFGDAIASTSKEYARPENGDHPQSKGSSQT